MPRRRWNSSLTRAWPILAVIALGVAATALAAINGSRTAEREARARFEQRVESLRLALVDQLDGCAGVLRAAAGVISAAATPDHADWRRFVESLQLDQQFEGVLGVAYVASVPAWDRDGFEARIRETVDPTYQLRPIPGGRLQSDVSYPIVLYEPRAVNAPVIGRDAASGSLRGLLERARDEATIAMSDPLALVPRGGASPRGVVIYLPVYRTGLAPGSVEQRRAAHAGWVAMAIESQSFVAGHWRRPWLDLDLAIVDSSASDPVLFTDRPSDELDPTESSPLRPDPALASVDTDAATGSIADGMQSARAMRFGGQRWVLLAAAPPSGGATLMAAMGPMQVGATGTLLLTLLTWSLLRTRTKAVELAEKMTDSLRSSEQRLTLVLDATADAAWDWDLVTDRVLASPRFRELLGREEMPQRAADWWDLMHPDDQPRVQRSLQDCLEGRTQVFRAEYRMRNRYGSWVWVMSRARIVERGPDGSPRRMVGVKMDITASKVADAERARTYALLRAVSDSSDDAVYVKDREGRYLMGNPTMGALVGRPVEEMIGMTDEAVFPPDQAAAMREADDRVFQGGASIRLEETITTHRGTRCFLTTKSPLRDETGKLVGVIGVSRDVTDYKIALNEAEAANEAKSEFLANMSHEIRTPMTAILGFADLVAEDGPDRMTAARRREAIETIRRNGEHLLGIINDILDLSKIEAGKMTLELLRFSPIALVEEVAALMRVRADGKGLRLVVEPVLPLPETIETDPVRLRQVLVNLIGNAIKFTEQGSVRIRLQMDESDPPRLRFEVVDSGIGMSADEMSRLFRPFSQADASTTRRFGGTGLGLTISARLVQILGGSIEVSSAAGMGSTFAATIEVGSLENVPMTTTLPSLSGADGAALDQGPRRLAERVLVAEDGIDNQRLLELHLRQAGADVELVDNGRKAIEAVQAAAREGRPFGLILMDMQMPELDGYEAARRLRDAGFRTPIVALTAHAMSGDRRKCLDAGCDAYQTKPIDRDTLVRVCCDALAGVTHRVS